MTNFRLKLKELADDNSKFDENGREFSERVENAEGKGEIARYDQFLLFPQCFNRLVQGTCKNQRLIWERVNSYPNNVFWTLQN